MKKWFHLFIVGLIFIGGFCVSSIAHVQADMRHGVSEKLAVHEDVLDCCGDHEEVQQIASLSKFQIQKKLFKLLRSNRSGSTFISSSDLSLPEISSLGLLYPPIEKVVFLE